MESNITTFVNCMHQTFRIEQIIVLHSLQILITAMNIILLK